MAKNRKKFGELHSLFQNFDIQYYSSLSESDIESVLFPWFKVRKIGSLAMKKGLKNLIKTANKLLNFSKKYGSLEKFISWALLDNNSDIKLVAYHFGSFYGQNNLPTMGILTTAEALKNIGFDIAKPDAHIRRAIGSFGLFEFGNWSDKSKSKAPVQSEPECIEVMKILEIFAKEVGERVALLDSAIRLICARSGLYATNEQLRNLCM